MGAANGILKGAAVAIADMRDNCARLQPGQEVLILAHTDGLRGGDNVVDEEAVAWIQSGVNLRGANATVLWIDEPARAHAWRLPPIARAAIGACDALINNSCTGDIRSATFRVGEVLVHDRGHLTALDDPAVIAVAAKYPGRPGLGPEPRSC